MTTFLLLGILTSVTLVYAADRQIGDFEPKYGPQSGGTEVFIIVSDPDGLVNISVTIAAETFYFDIGPVNYSTQYGLLQRCYSSPVPDRTVNKSGNIVLHYDDGMMISTHEPFQYRPDPIIEEVTPLKSIIRGGIVQTIRGQHLDSVLNWRLRMTLVEKFDSGQTKKSEQLHYLNDIGQHQCTAQDNSTVFCPSMPFSVYQVPKGSHNPITGINTDDYQIYVGFEIDGVETYLNYSVIYVFADPKFTDFPGDNNVKAFKTYKGEEYLEIGGDHMNFVATEEDYTVTIGNSTCEIIEVITNNLRCRPPQERPPLGNIDYRGSPAVYVNVGFLDSFVGYLKYEAKPWDDPTVRTIVYASVGAGVAFIILVVVVAVVIKRRKKQRPERLLGSSGYTRPPGLMDRVPPDLKVLLQPCMKDAQRLRIGKALGEGNFGSVHAGKFVDDSGQTVLVAAKTLKESGVTPAQFREFLEEATLMRDFNHTHVLHLVGVVFKEGRPYVLLPYMENGDLRSFLLNVNNAFTVEDLLHYDRQAAAGMSYLEDLKCVHRDLAARNCMVSKENVVKIADFGLARDMYQDDYYRVGDMSRPLPVKWMAPECLDDHKFTSKSDVWSFGVLTWELLTRGKKPYAHVDNYSLKPFLLSGRRLERPDVAPDTVYELMLKCWNLVPHQRPTFQAIVEDLEQILSSEEEEPTFFDEPRARTTAVEVSDAYQNLSRYVDRPHGYQRISHIPEEGATAADPKQEIQGIDYKEGRPLFDDILDPHEEDGYMAPTNGNVEAGRVNPGFQGANGAMGRNGYAQRGTNDVGYLSPLATGGGARQAPIDQPPNSVSYQNMSAMSGQQGENRYADHAAISIKT